MSYPELKLSNQICFLVHRIDQVLNALYRPLLEPLGLTYTQYLAMLVLWEKDDIGIGELCARLGVDTGTVSPLAKRLEAAGLVQRVRRADDERSVVVRLTDKGRGLEQRAVEVPRALATCYGAQPGEYAEMHRNLSEMLARLE